MATGANSNESSLQKALQLLVMIGEGERQAGARVRDMLTRLNVSRATAYRLLKELESFGFVRAIPKSTAWGLGPRVIALASQSANWDTMRRKIKVAMRECANADGRTIHLAIRDGVEVVYVDKLESVRQPAAFSAVGQRRPVNVTALGKCLVAFDANPGLAVRVADAGLAKRTAKSIVDRGRWFEEISRVRRQGVAYDIEECEAGISCVAAPVRDDQGSVIAAVGISVIAPDCVAAKLACVAEEVRRLAGNLNRI
jgi:DNA-binding IclR family transcriptional regulator